jgi:ribosomal small subunit protein bTHX
LPAALVSYAPSISRAARLRAHSTTNPETPMGRGDKKTRKGKIAIRSYGNVRPHKSAGTNAPVAKKAAAPKAAVK